MLGRIIGGLGYGVYPYTISRGATMNTISREMEGMERKTKGLKEDV